MGAHLCYVDESGDVEPLHADRPDAPPAFVLVGVIVPQARQKNLIWDFLQLKKEFEPQLCDVRLRDVIDLEVKGSKLRKDLRRDRGERNRRRRAFGFIDKTLRVVEDNGGQLIGKVVIKDETPSRSTDAAVYGQAIADLAQSFDRLLAAADSHGLMILDSRTKAKNEGNVHGITTRRFKQGGDSFPNLLEAPVFGHSNTHVPLQVADIIASAVVFPSAAITYCSHLSWNVHPHPRYAEIRERFGDRVQRLEYRYVDALGARRGGFQVIDPQHHRPTHKLFRD